MLDLRNGYVETVGAAHSSRIVVLGSRNVNIRAARPRGVDRARRAGGRLNRELTG